jgi:hypothetical protein
MTARQIFPPQPTDAHHDEILRLIGNARQEHGICAMARGRSGMEDFGVLAHLLESVSTRRLEEYLYRIDKVRSTHAGCPLCSLKFIAFCRIFSASRLLPCFESYSEEYRRAMKNLKKHHRSGRNFMREARQAIAAAVPTRRCSQQTSAISEGTWTADRREVYWA